MAGQILAIQERTKFENRVASSCMEGTKSSTVLVKFPNNNKTAECTSFVAVRANPVPLSRYLFYHSSAKYQLTSLDFSSVERITLSDAHRL
jgi:hypothetical protein